MSKPSTGVNLSFSFNFTVPESCIRAYFGLPDQGKASKRDKKEKKRLRRQQAREAVEANSLTSESESEKREENRRREIEYNKNKWDTSSSEEEDEEDNIVDVDEKLINKMIEELCEEYGVDDEVERIKFSSFIHNRYAEDPADNKHKHAHCASVNCSICNLGFNNLVKRGTPKEIKDALVSQLEKSQALVIDDFGKKKLIVSLFDVFDKIETGVKSVVSENEDGSKTFDMSKMGDIFNSIPGMLGGTQAGGVGGVEGQGGADPLNFMKGFLENIMGSFGKSMQDSGIAKMQNIHIKGVKGMESKDGGGEGKKEGGKKEGEKKEKKEGKGEKKQEEKQVELDDDDLEIIESAKDKEDNIEIREIGSGEGKGEKDEMD